MILDLHAHYPMHLGAWSDPPLATRMKQAFLDAANRRLNFPNPRHGPAVTIPLARVGGVGALLSVLFDPFSEMDLTRPFQGGYRPRDRYFRDLLAQLERVETDINEHWSDEAAIVRNVGELEAQSRSGKVAVVHAVEGGFHLGSAPIMAEEAVTELARRGVAYVTLAHLFFRSVATTTNSFPFLTDRLYRALFPQPDIGLTILGTAILERMFEEGVLVDLSHMGDRTIRQTLDLYDHWDPDCEVPVLASHVACRLNKSEYNLSDESIARIGKRGGVIGIIVGRYQLKAPGLPAGRNFVESFELISTHIDRIRSVTGSFDNIGIGTDLDGYISPVRGLDSMASLAGLETALKERYGEHAAQQVLSENSLRALKKGWGVKRERKAG